MPYNESMESAHLSWFRTHRNPKRSRTLETEIRLPGSFSQHLGNILHNPMAPLLFFSPSSLRGRSPSRILDFTPVASAPFHMEVPMNILVGLLRRYKTTVRRTHLCGDKTIREHIGLFGQFAVLKDLRCRPSATVGPDLGPIEARSPGGYELGKSDVREASMACGIHEDVFLSTHRDDYTENYAPGRTCH